MSTFFKQEIPEFFLESSRYNANES